MSIRLYDSLKREVRELKPAQPDGVFRFYNCGPTVYAPAHIGNFRTFLVNDVIRRLLELEFGKDKVKHVRNLTDVDDKTIRRAREEGRPLGDVTRQWTDKFHADCAALNCLPPHEEPRATDPRHMREQTDMIEVLMRKGNAYRAADGSVYFKVSSFSDYGKLSRVKERELQPGDALKALAADADEKEDGSDFALWKAWKPDDGANKWPGPKGAGEGRPGWHIECSAMSKSILGDTIDLHTGGVDLLFPHHENEIAQSECCNGKPLSHHWYHSEHLLVDGKKMSKSLGNLYTLDELTAKGFSAMAVRYTLLAGHPRKQLNFTLDSLHAAESALNSLSQFIHFFCERAELPLSELSHWIDSPQPYQGNRWLHVGGFPKILREDLNIPGALGELFTRLFLCRQGMLNPADMKELLIGLSHSLFVLGLNPLIKKDIQASSQVTALAEKRWAAKQAKDFKTSDALRAELTAAGWSMLDGKDGYKLEPVKK